MVHPIFDRFQWQVTPGGDLWEINPMGARTRRSYNAGVTEVPTTLPSSDNPVGLNEEFFEWVDLLESVAAARDTYTMIELGAGYGRWIANAAAALRQTDITDYRFIGVEGEPTHFQWLRDNLTENEIDLSRCELIHAAVNADGRDVLFQSRESGHFFGQAIYSLDPYPLAVFKRFVKRFTKKFAAAGREPVHRVSGVTLNSILEPLPLVDLIDIDIQGAEGPVIGASLDALTAKVRRLHIETHNEHVEQTIRTDLARAGWDCLNDYPFDRTSETPYGPVFFQGGIQTWVNPRLLPPR